MKKELIKTPEYLLVVDDSEIKEGDWLIVNDEDVMQMKSDYDNDMSNEDIWVGDSLNGYATYKDNCKKIIAHLPLNNSPILEGVPLLPSLEDDVEKMAKDYLFNDYQNHFNVKTSDEQFGVFKGYMNGYNKAREKYKFTEEDVRFMIMKSFLLGVDRGQYSKELEDKLITSLSQPKMPTHIEFETESMSVDEIREQGKGFLHGPTFKIKTTTNSQGQQVACGKYIY
jgi:hypothetical protein